MATYAKQLLSGGANGRNILVAATGSAGTLIHTAVTGTVSYDEIFLWVNNTSANAVLLTIEFGGTSNPGDRVVVTVPGYTTMVIIPGWLLNNAVVVRAFAATTNVLVINGFVNRIT